MSIGTERGVYRKIVTRATLIFLLPVIFGTVAAQTTWSRKGRLPPMASTAGWTRSPGLPPTLPLHPARRADAGSVWCQVGAGAHRAAVDGTAPDLPLAAAI